MVADKAVNRILLVEDDRDIREALVDVLEIEGYQVTSAANGQDALDRLRRESQLPDLILLDLMMPVKDGFEFRNEQVADARIANVPVIIMSADHNVESKSQSLTVCGFLKKPVEIDQLLAAIEGACA